MTDADSPDLRSMTGFGAASVEVPGTRGVRVARVEVRSRVAEQLLQSPDWKVYGVSRGTPRFSADTPRRAFSHAMYSLRRRRLPLPM